jgi:hypothetical protein
MSERRPPDGQQEPAGGGTAEGGTAEGVPAGGVPAPRPRPRAIARSEFEQVIRRAAELTLRDADADADEQLSEEEVLRIATELGLPAHHVRRALFELPELATSPRWYDRYFGPSIFSVGREVPGQPGPLLRRLEEYLVTREYLQIVRRRGDNLALIPADDTISSLARTFFRPGHRHHIAGATRVMVSAHALPDDGAHLRIDIDLTADRSSGVKNGATVGIVGGAIVGALAAGLVGGFVPPVAGVVPEVLAFGGGVAATFAASFSAAAARFRRRAFAARLEVAGLLDRLEHGERLEPPPAPWRRRLQLRLFGSRAEPR